MPGQCVNQFTDSRGMLQEQPEVECTGGNRSLVEANSGATSGAIA